MAASLVSILEFGRQCRPFDSRLNMSALLQTWQVSGSAQDADETGFSSATNASAEKEISS
jgi:hypothetical protein